MSNKMNKILSSCAFLLCLSSCSVDTGNSVEVDQTNIFGGYHVIQDQPDAPIQILTWFRYAGPTGTTLRLTAPSEVSVNAQKLNLVDGSSRILNLTGSYYTNSFSASEQVGPFEFEWKRNDGQIFRNSVPAPQKIEAVLLGEGTEVVKAGEVAKISVAKGGFAVTFDGSDLRADETIECTLWSNSEDYFTGQDNVVSAQWSSSLKNCVFTKEKLQRFRKGSARLEMSRIWRQVDKALGHERAGSTMTSSFKSRPIECEISD